MKKAHVILMLLVGCLSHGQVPQQKGVVISRELLPYLKEYIKSAKHYGFDVIPHLSQMDSIVYSDRVQFPNVGLAKMDGSQVLVNKAARIESLAVRAIMFHELSHAIFKLPHCESCESSDIMHPSSPKSFSIFANEEFWKKKVEELFIRIDCKINKDKQ